MAHGRAEPVLVRVPPWLGTQSCLATCLLEHTRCAHWGPCPGHTFPLQRGLLGSASATLSEATVEVTHPGSALIGNHVARWPITEAAVLALLWEASSGWH